MSRKRGGHRGRGGSRGGSRGGGSLRPLHLSKSLKRRSRARSNRQDMPELMDLSEDVYVPERGSEHPRMSMKSLSKRPNRRMIDEVRYTDQNFKNTMNQPLRKRPIEFVKAKEAYDPSKELIEKLKKLNNQDPLAENMELLRVEETVLPLSDLRGNEEKLKNGECVEGTNESDKKNETSSILDSGTETHIAVSENSDMAEASEGNKVAEEVEIEMGDELEQSEYIEMELEEREPEVEEAEGQEEDGPGDEDDQDEDVEVDEDIEVDEDVEAVEDDQDEDDEVHEEDGYIDDDHSEHVGQDEELEDELEFVIDNDGDSNLLLSQTKLFTREIIQQHRDQPLAISARDEPVPALEHVPHFSVGKVLLRTTVSPDGTVETSLPMKKPDKGFQDLGQDLYEESDDTDEEAAFEDYMSQLMMANSVASDMDSQGSLDEEEEEEDDDDIDDLPLNSDEEGLEEILSFARNQQRSFSDLDMPPTQTLKKKGKGKNLRLDINDEIEMELRQSLLEQFQYQRQSRKAKKLRKKEQSQQMAIANNDLNEKYDYMLHIKEIKQEFESFLHDASRESMSFPPLDGHGNKTLNKLANAYNMKCTRCGGNGLHMYMKVTKTRKTFHYLPDYNQINSTLRQRPVFKRTDVKSRPKEEIEETDGKKGRRGPKNDAYVREGDIVGGKAPEIGANNIGRQLLEKLGWVKGEGLGAHGNKGISEPLLATVKKSKTGLK